MKTIRLVNRNDGRGRRIRRLIDRMNRSRAGRISLYLALPAFLRFLRHPGITDADIIEFYAFHLFALRPWFAGELTPTGISSRLARRYDETFIDAIHACLLRIADIERARKLNRDLQHFERMHRLTRMAAYPNRIYLELTDQCNLRCPMCTQVILAGERTHLPLETIDKVRTALRYMDLISFVGCGETFVHPQFREVMQAIPSRTARTQIITNGILLTEDTSRFLVEQQLNELWISVDATDAATFWEIRRSRQFEPILENIRVLQRVKRDAGSDQPHVSMNFVARRCNIEQLPQFVRMSHELGAEKVNVGFLQVYSRDLVKESLFFHQELADRCMDEARRVAEEVGIALYLPGRFGEETPLAARQAPPERRYGEKCTEPYQFVYVRAEGTLGPCCVNDTRLGNLNEHSFEALWNGPEYRDFRRRVSTPEEDLHCKHCMLEGHKDIRDVNAHVKLIAESDLHVEEDDYEKLARE